MMTNISRLTIGQLSWVVLVLTISILAVGTMTKAFADQPERISLDDLSGQIDIEMVEIIQVGPPSQDSAGEAVIPIQVVDLNFETVDQELPQHDPEEFVEVEIEPVDLQQGDVPQLDPSQGLQLDPEPPASDDSSEQDNDSPTEPEQPPVPVESELVELGLTGDTPLLPGPFIPDAFAPEPEDVPIEPEMVDTDDEDCKCDELTAAVVKPTVKTTKRGLRQQVTVTIPYEWSLDCEGDATRYNDRCSGELNFDVKADGWQYVDKDGAFLDAKLPPHGEAIIEGGKAKQKGEGPAIEVTCVGRNYCKDSTGKGQFQYSFLLTATSKMTGKVLFTVTTECEGETVAHEAMIYVDSSLRGGVDEPYSDYDGDGVLNEFDKQPQDPNRS